MVSAGPFSTLIPDFSQWTLGNWVGFLLLWGVLFVIGAFVYKIWRRAANSLEETIFSNWRLALLGATGLVLSLASGWTTWDGMRNFTGEPALSFMITFGIQGVMLIVAWLIGETFATGMNLKNSGQTGGWDLIVTGLFAVLAIVAVMLWLGQGSQHEAVVASNWFNSQAAQTIKNFALFGAVTALILAFVIAATKSDVGADYVQSARLIIKNGILWIMFLACMATSVFFSFDSLFSTIFPAEERKRSADIRAVNQVAAVVTDIGNLAQKRRVEEARALFQSQAWTTYETELDKVAALAKQAPDKIREQITLELQTQQSRIAKLEEQRATATGGQAGLQSKKVQLTEELSRLQADRPGSVSEFNAQKLVVADIERRIDEQRAKVMAEEKGVEGSLKAGRGQFWRAAKAEEEKAKAELQVAKERLRSPQARVETIDKRLAQIKGELAQIDGDLAKLKGEEETTVQMIAVARSGSAATSDERFDPSAGVAALDRARQQFRQNPERQSLAQLQSSCSALINASLKVTSLRDDAAAIDCSPKLANEAAGRVFSLNDGLALFGQNCSGGEKLPTTGGTDALLEFGRRCLQDSGLGSQDTQNMGLALSRIDLNRDDRAHRFVVTWNAFQDGNRLAYLALAIAIAIDSLVFMSGLFGANAVRSPLSDMPSPKARSAKQLEAIIENALLPDTFTNADAVLSAMQPITPIDGFTQEVLVPMDETPTRGRVVKVLNAAATIGAVHRDLNRPERYLVRPELFEFLSTVAKRAFESNSENVKLAELKQVVTVALQPEVAVNAEIVLSNMDPINEAHGFSSQIKLSNVKAEQQGVVRKVLNAGATMQYVQLAEKHPDRDLYFVHGQLYKIIALIAASSVRPVIGAPRLPAGYGGSLNAAPPLPPHATVPRVAPPRQVPPRPQLTQQHPSLTPEDRRRFASVYMDQLLSAIGLQSTTLVMLEQQPALWDAAVSAWKALQDHARHNKTLDQLLKRQQGEHERELDRMLNSLAAATDDNQQKIDILDGLDNRIREALPALMMFPETGLVRFLIEELESAASPDDGHMPGESELLVQLREVADVMSYADLGDADSWERIRHALTEGSASDSGDFPRVVQMRQPRRGQGQGQG